MHFRIEQQFPGSVEEVEAALLDPAFLERLSELPRLGRPTLLDQLVDGHIVRQRVQYHFAGELSSAVRRVVDPQRLSWVEESTLDRQTHLTTWQIVPDNYKNLLRCAGTFLLEPVDNGGCRRVAEADLRVNVPLVGNRVEQAIVSGLREHAAAEEEVMAAWLEDNPGSP